MEIEENSFNLYAVPICIMPRLETLNHPYYCARVVLFPPFQIGFTFNIIGKGSSNFLGVTKFRCGGVRGETCFVLVYLVFLFNQLKMYHGVLCYLQNKIRSVGVPRSSQEKGYRISKLYYMPMMNI